VSRFVQRHPAGTLAAFLGTMLIAGGVLGAQAVNSANLKAKSAEIQEELAKEKAEKEKQAKIIAEMRAQTAETEVKGQSQSLNKLQSLEHLAQNENYYSAALQIINEAVNASDQFWKPYLVRAKHYAEFGHHEEAEADFERAQELFREQHKKESVEIWFEAGMYYGLPIEIGGKGEEDTALEYFEKAAKKEGVFSELSEAVALMIKTKQDISNAEEYIPEAIALSDKLIQDPVAQNIDATWLVRAFIFGASGFHGYDVSVFEKYADFKNACDALLNVVKEDSGLPALRNFLASAYERIQPDKALEIYARLISDTNDFKYLNNRGLFLTKLGRLQEAFQDFDKALQLNPRHAYLYNNRAMAHSLNGEPDLALADLNKALALEPNFAKSAYQRANIYYEQHTKESMQHALEDLNNVISHNPSHAQALNLRGMIYHDLGRNKNAISDYEAAINAEPTYAEAYFNLGNSFYEGNDFVRAEINYVRALEISPTDWQFLTNLAAVYFKQEFYEKSKNLFEKALQYAPENKKEMIEKNISVVKSKLK
jgi:tetratricopeptide (TPR) repeat protein